MFEELIKEITKELEAKESRSRARSAAPHARFKYAVSFLIGELWKNSLSLCCVVWYFGSDDHSWSWNFN
jgi:hypothetical protein